MRLQGVDTPELHYPVLSAWHELEQGRYANEFRQPYAAGAALALHDYLQGFIGTAGELLDSSGRPVIREQYVSPMKKGQKGKADAAYLRDYFLANIDRLNPKQRGPLADTIGPQGQALFKARRSGVPRGRLHALVC